MGLQEPATDELVRGPLDAFTTEALQLLLSPEMPFRQSERNQREQERFHSLPLLVRVALLLAGEWQGERAAGAHPREGGASGLRLRPSCSRCGRLPLALDHLLVSYIHG